RKLALPDQARIPLRACDAEPVHTPWTAADASVTEIEAEQVGVWRLREQHRITAAYSAGTIGRPGRVPHPIEVWRLAPSPLLDSASRDACLTCDLAVVPARLGKGQDRCHFLS